MNKLKELALEDQSDLEGRLKSFLESGPLDKSTKNTAETVKELYGEELIDNFEESDLLSMDFKIRKAVDRLLVEIESYSEEDFEDRSDYIRRLIKIAYRLRLETSVQTLIDLFAFSEMEGFWRKNFDLKSDIKKFLLDYFGGFQKRTAEVSRTMERIEERNREIEKGTKRLI